MKTALISGITGQDGSYLAEFLLSKGYKVHGIIRRSSTFNTARINHLYSDFHESDIKLFLHYGDLSDSSQISNLIHKIQPDEVYNLGAQTHVRVSFDMPEYTGDITAIAVTRFLESLKNIDKKIKFYQASTSEIFGNSPPPQNEKTFFSPTSPYATAKLYGYWMTKIYREGYNIFSSNGILFNHESPRRGETFVTKKISHAVANIVKGVQKKLYLGNLEAKRDWGYSPEYVESMWKILQCSHPDDYVIGTGESHSVQEYLVDSFNYVGLNYKKYIEIDQKYLRPTETENLIADSQKAKTDINWSPKIKYNDLVKIMIDADFRKIGLEPIGDGDKIIKRVFPRPFWKGD